MANRLAEVRNKPKLSPWTTNEHHEPAKRISFLHVDVHNVSLYAFPEVSWFSLAKFSPAQNNPESLPFTLQYMSECLYSFNPQYARSNASEPGIFPLFIPLPGSIPISHPITNPEGLFTV